MSVHSVFDSTTTSSNPPPTTSEKVSGIMLILTDLHGPGAAASVAAYSAHLHHAVRLSTSIMERVSQLEDVPEGEIRTAAESFLSAADAVGEIAGTPLISGKLLVTVPGDMLARIIRAGLEAEAEELLELLSSIKAPEDMEGGQAIE